MQFTQAIAAAILAYTAVAAPAGAPHFELGTPLVQGNCEQLDTHCRTQPGANMAQCSAEQAQCEDKCSKAATECRTAPGANQSTCSADYAACLGKNPYERRGEPSFQLGEPLTQPAPHSQSGEPLTRPAPRGEPTPQVGEPLTRQTCKDADNECRTKPGANMAQCSAEKAQCMDSCDKSDSTCRTAPNANMAQCSANKAQCYGFNPYERRSEPTPQVGEPLTRQTCKDADNECRTKPGANMAQCSAEKAQCMDSCDKSDSTCRTAPDANMSFCSAAKAQCYGFNPYQKKRSEIGELRGPIAENPLDKYDGTQATNAKGVLHHTKAAVRVMLQQEVTVLQGLERVRQLGRGAIVNTCSVAGLSGQVGMAEYTASKFAAVGITKVAANEYGTSQIRINGMCPGPVETPMLERMLGGQPESRTSMINSVPLRRIADVDEIADAILFLTGVTGSYVTGTSMVVDGGFLNSTSLNL